VKFSADVDQNPLGKFLGDLCDESKVCRFSRFSDTTIDWLQAWPIQPDPKGISGKDGAAVRIFGHETSLMMLAG
jgi:hypothetical protein